MGLEPDPGVLPAVALRPDDADAVGYVERSLATSPVWQMGTRTPRQRVARPDPNLLDFLASTRKAPLGELEFDLLTWAITRWYQSGRPADGRLAATFGDITYALYGGRKGGKQYVDVREALDGLYNVSIDLSVVTIDERGLCGARPVGGGSSRSSTWTRICPRMRSATRTRSSYGSARGSSSSLDANTVAAIGWQTLRSLGGIAKRLAIFLAAHAAEFEPITRHTERFVVELSDEFYEQLGGHRRARAPAPAIGGSRGRADCRA